MVKIMVLLHSSSLNLNEEDAAQVLYEVGNTNYIYEKIGECIDYEVRRVMISNSYQRK